MSSLNVLALVLLAAGLSVGDSDWSYKGKNGPNNWGKTYPDCNGKRQSPIDLNKAKEVKQPELKWTDYDDIPDNMTLKNNGTTVVLTGEGVEPRITLDNGKIYQLENVHFHWGKKDKNGSEHTLEGRRFTMEMHGVHSRVEDDGTPVSPTEYIIIAYFFQETRKQYIDNGLSNFIRDMSLVVDANTETSVEPFAWSKLLRQFTSKFFWYEGSMTRPPCNEVVTFFVNPRIQEVTRNQIMEFRDLLDEDDEPISGNARPLQKRNGRDINFVQNGFV